MSIRKTIVVNDAYQKGYSYRLRERPGKNFDAEFKPHLTPAEMLSLGVFGGAYFSPTDTEFPMSWYKKAKLSKDGTPDKKLNFYGVNASQPLSEWKRKGWIYKDDPRGWFQWYCRYYRGRRIPQEDARQIRRWKNFARHAHQVVQNCRAGDSTCRPVQRQALLHWAYDSRRL